MTPTVVLYTKPGCHLCEKVLERLLAVRQTDPFDLIEQNIVDDPGLFSKYAEEIPVVTVNGDFFCKYRVDEMRLRARLKEVTV